MTPGRLAITGKATEKPRSLENPSKSIEVHEISGRASRFAWNHAT